MRLIGFSTGALARSDFRQAISLLKRKAVNAIELSALRFAELRPLLESLAELDLQQYKYIALHAPSRLTADEEVEAAKLLKQYAPQTWQIIVHPDALKCVDLWRYFGNRLAVENMDRRKPVGRTADELRRCFDSFPDATLCFDIGHARQVDTTMTEAYRILREFARKLCQVHVSEVNSASQHDRLSYAAILAFEQVAGFIPPTIPLILESRVEPEDIDSELAKAQQALASEPIAISA